MKKSIFIIVSLLLMITVAFSSVATAFSAVEKKIATEYEFSEKTPFIRYEDENGIHYIGATGNDASVVDNIQSTTESAESSEVSAADREKGELVAVGNALLPDSVDLSTSKYFPPVGNQGGLGSCATFSTTYYQLSYEINKQSDREATAENTLSPQLVFNLMSSDEMTGTVADFNYGFLKLHGAPSMGLLPYSDSDRLSWHASEQIWNDAMDSRVDEFFTIEDVGGEDTQITSADDEDLNEIKTVLANGNVIVYGTCIYSWVGDRIVAHPDAPENAKFEGEEIVKYQDGFNGAHSMTLVGYNDNIWVDQNSNGNVDSGEMGAFKIANSWGDGYANGGFCWVAYDALNKVSAVEGGFNGNRGSALNSFKWITVKPYAEGSKIYVRFTLNTEDRVQMNVDFSAEHNGVEETNRFLLGSSYRNDFNRFGFDGTAEATDGTFCYALDNVSSELCESNFEDYCFSATFEDTDADGKELQVKNVEVVNEYTGKVYKMSTEPFTVDGEKKTVLVKDAETTDKIIYYIGFDEPTLNYKIADGEFTAVKMEYTEARLGHNYRFILEDTPEDVTLYFTDENGNVDDNGRNYYTASDRLNFYRTKDVREPLEIHGFDYENGLPDVNKRSYFLPDVTGGYEPYNFQYTVEYIETGKVSTYPYESKIDKCHAFYYAGKYNFTIEVRDQSGDVSVYKEVLDIIDRSFEFASLTASSQYGKSLFVGENTELYAVTEFEDIISRGPHQSKYEFVIKDADSKVCYAKTVEAREFHMGDCISHVYLDWIPEKKGDYTVTVSSTDDNKEYAEITTEFTVFDKIYGDADGSGNVSVKDATLVQKRIADLDMNSVFCSEMADCDVNGRLSVKDATCIRKYLARIENSGEAGKIIEYIPPVTEPETTPAETTEPEPTVIMPTEPAEENIVTFTNSHKWSGSIYCYYWSDTNSSMTTWPGNSMNYSGTNEFGESYYSYTLPEDATYVIFTNGSYQTVDIPYSGGEAKYYPLTTTNNIGHYEVAFW